MRISLLIAKLVLAILAILSFQPVCVADDFTWTGAGGNSLWTNPGNWTNTSGGVAIFPDADDNVLFDIDATTSGGSALGLVNSATLQATFGTIAIHGSSVTNNGELTYVGAPSNGANEVYQLATDVTLAGSGTLRLKEQSDSFVIGLAGTEVLTNSATHTIRGAGEIWVEIVNAGTLIAEGGALILTGGAVDNSTGTIQIASDGALTATGTTISGGVLNSAVGGLLGNGGTLKDLEVSGTVTQSFGTTVLEGTIVNNAVLTYRGVPANSANEVLQINSPVTLTGSGELVMKEISDSFLAGTGTLTNTGGHTLRGSGTIRPDVLNAGGIVQVDAGARLFFENSTITGGIVNSNVDGRLVGSTVKLKDLTTTGTMVREFGTTLLEGTITNNGELTYAAAPSNGSNEVYQLATDVTLAGSGTLRLKEQIDSFVTGLAGTEVLTNSATHTIRGAGEIQVDVVNEGTLIAEEGLLILLGGAVDNSTGAIQIASTGTLTATGTTISGGTLNFAVGSLLGSGGTLKDLEVSGTATQSFGTTALQGTITNNGELTYAAAPSNGTNEAYQLATGVTLAGSGTLRLKEQIDSFVTGLAGTEVLTNSATHTIRGTGEIQVEIVNAGTLIAEEGVLILLGGAVDNSTGTIQIASNGALTATGTTISGGVLNSAVGGLLGNGATLNGLEVSGTVTQSFGTTILEGTITNNAVLTYQGVPSNGSNEVFQINSPVTFTGSGELVMKEVVDSFLAGTGTLTNTGGHTIRGTGTIQVDVLNAGGFVQVDAGARLFFENSTITGGLVHSDASGRLVGNTVKLKDLTTTGNMVREFGTTSLEGTITNNGELTYAGAPSNSSNEVYQLATDVTLAGSGTLQLKEQNDSFVSGLAGTEVLTNSAAHTIRGTGTIAVDVVNEGTVQPGTALGFTKDYTQTAAGEFEANNFALFNWGKLTVTGDATLDGELVIDYSGIPVGTFVVDVLLADQILGDFSGVTIVDTLPWVGTATHQILVDEIGTTDVVRLTVTNSASGLQGDYNNDGVVDAADYTIWQDLLGSTLNMPNDVTLGAVTQSDYDVWKSNFGQSVPAADISTAVPEPNSNILLAILLLSLSVGVGRRCSARGIVKTLLVKA